ncbi:MAG TPA: hypothetical protein VGQ28_11415 [Thermoanaerobaculia bacterium]|jgi:hypothetical protein|nr:hypothetical protein [Thermoanaerobaculia bacterium]
MSCKSRRLRRLSLPLLVLLLVLLAGAAPKPAALPEGVTPLPAAGAQHMQTLLEAAEKYRGLHARSPIPAGTLEEAGLKKKLLESMRQHMPAESLRAVEVSLKAFGLIPETMSLDKYLPELLTSQVAGYYDTEKKYLAMVRRRGAAGKEDAAAGDDDDMVLVHELTHALQDQSFDLEKLENDDDPLSDAGTAVTALVEGDATLTMIDFQAQASLENTPGASRMVSSMLGDPDKLAKALPDLPGADQFEKAPVWLRDNLMFGYLQGLTFCMSTRSRGGQKLLDYAFTTDPPRSTEQILHPEKWHTRRDDPIVVRLPDLAAELPGYVKAAEGVMGELGIRSLLHGEHGDWERALKAAEGWGGDRFAVYEKKQGETKGSRLLLWVSEWDTEEDEQEFQVAAAALGNGWKIVGTAPRRVVAMRSDHGDLTDSQREAILARLAAAPVERPVNREIDLTAIGAKPPDALSRP